MIHHRPGAPHGFSDELQPEQSDFRSQRKVLLNVPLMGKGIFIPTVGCIIHGSVDFICFALYFT
jgi:hypothetical protein